MYERTNVDRSGQSGAALFDSACAACGGSVRLHLSSRTTESTRGKVGAITYADTDIAVWDCPACGFTNADAFSE
ncbi:MAG TPA: hypothetical protein VFI99_05690 [Nocardioides sp.]|nr:hypothetical protein [Nocardioides sp.]